MRASTHNVNQFEALVKELIAQIESSSLTPEKKHELLKTLESLVQQYSHDINEIISALEHAQRKYDDITQTLREFERMDFVGMLMRVQNEMRQMRDDLRAVEKHQEKRLEDVTSQVLSRVVKLEKAIQEPLRDYARLRTFFTSTSGKALIIAVAIYLVLNILLVLVGVLK